jgi:hypothetical protein
MVAEGHGNSEINTTNLRQFTRKNPEIPAHIAAKHAGYELA